YNDLRAAPSADLVGSCPINAWLPGLARWIGMGCHNFLEAGHGGGKASGNLPGQRRAQVRVFIVRTAKGKNENFVFAGAGDSIGDGSDERVQVGGLLSGGDIGGTGKERRNREGPYRARPEHIQNLTESESKGQRNQIRRSRQGRRLRIRTWEWPR